MQRKESATGGIRSTHFRSPGFVDCRATSKTLGIGVSERSWGDVKSTKDGKRASLSSEKLEKQSVCYTSACLEEACMLRNAGKDDNKASKVDAASCCGVADEKFELQLEVGKLV